MSAGGRALLAVVLLGLVAPGCGDVSSPRRTQAYEWRLVNGTDTLSFHWPRSALPVRYWAEDANNLPGYVDSAIVAWKAAFLYGEFDAVRVADSTQADVIVTTAEAPAGGGTLLAMAPECEGVTDVAIDSVNRLHLPIHMFVQPRFSTDDPATQTCLALVTIHEMGHSIGIFRHAPDPSDIMYFDPTVTAPSAADRETAELVYHKPATVTLTRDP